MLILLRYLTPRAFGLYSLAVNVSAVFTVFFGLGLGGAGRLYFDYVDDDLAVRRYMSTVIRASFISTWLVTALSLMSGSWLLNQFVPHFAVPFYPYIALAIGGAALGQFAGFAIRFCQLQGRAQRAVVISLLVLGLELTITTAIVIVARRGVGGLLVAGLLSNAIASVVTLYLLRYWLTGGWKWDYVVTTWRLGVPLVLNPLLLVGLELVDRFILQRYRDIAEVGIYSLGYTYGMTMNLLASSIMLAWNPMFLDLARGGEEERGVAGHVMSGLIILLAAIAGLGVVAAQPFVAVVLDAQYQQAAQIIPLIIAAYLAGGLFGLFALSVVQSKRVGRLSVISAVALAVNVALNLRFVPSGGMYAAAYATLAAYVVAMLLMYWQSQRLYPWPHQRWRLASALLGFAAVLAATQLPLHDWRLLVACGVLLLFYGALWYSSRAIIAGAIKSLVRFPVNPRTFRVGAD